MSTRDTTQRRAILDALRVAGRPVTPQELLEHAQVQVPALGIATVYRNLARLQEGGDVSAVALPGQSTTRFELAGKAHHHHFHCRTCDGVYEIDACPGNLRGLAPTGFVLEDHEVVLYGLCAQCSP